MADSHRAKVSRDERRGTHIRVPAAIAERLPDGELEMEFAVREDDGVIELTPVEVTTKKTKLKAAKA
jgi:hypothetical protein